MKLADKRAYLPGMRLCPPPTSSWWTEPDFRAAYQRELPRLMQADKQPISLLAPDAMVERRRDKAIPAYQDEAVV